MKLKKLLASMLAVVAALTLTLGIAACGGNDDNDKDKDKNSTISYQFTGANDELSGYGWSYYVMLNLWSDGKVTGSGYNYLKTDDSGLKEKWFRGTWTEKQDEDAGKVIQLKAIWDEDATNDQTAPPTSTAGKLENYTLYFDADGKTLTPFTLKIPLMSERNAEMTCHVPAIYADKDAFIKGAKEYGATHKPNEGGDKEEDYGKALATLTSEDSKTAVFYDSGMVVIDANYVKPVLEWKYENGSFTFTETDGNNKGQVTDAATLTVEGTTGTLTYSFMTMNFSYTGDVSKLVGAEEKVTALATLTSEDGKTAVFHSDGTVKVTTGIPQLSPVWNWKYENGNITLAEEGKDTVPGGVTFTIEGTTGTLVYAPSFLQGSSLTYTGDISALIA